MPQFQLTREEYEGFTGIKSDNGVRFSWTGRSIFTKLVSLAIVGAIFIASLKIGQWLFATVWAAVVLSYFFLEFWWRPRKAIDSYSDDVFNSGVIDLTVTEHSVRAETDGNILQFRYDQLFLVWEYIDHFVFCHSGGNRLYVPKRALGRDELDVLTNIQKRYPAIARKMF